MKVDKIKVEKISVSLPAASSRFLERYRKRRALKTRSEVIVRAIRLLEEQELESAYRASARERDKAWDATTADGLADEAW